MSDTQYQIDRIDALTRNARNTWFVLLGALVFVSVTLMGVEHIDFYGVDRATELPLVNVSVPTRFFFYAAPVLIAAIYGYFHLYLIRLWDALSVAQAKQQDGPLGDVITPWLVTDAALHLRAWLRKDGCTTHRTMEGLAMLLNLLLAGVFGIAVLGWLWCKSATARDIWMTGVAALGLGAAVSIGLASFLMMWNRMQKEHDGARVNIWSSAPAMGAVLVLIPALFVFTHQRTMSSIPERLAPISMIDESIVERPKGWLPYSVAEAEFQDAWCKRKGRSACSGISNPEEIFVTDWLATRKANRSDAMTPAWNGPRKSKPDFRMAELQYAYLVGADLRWASMNSANLTEAQLEGSILFRTNFSKADLSRAQMQEAFLLRAHFVGTTFSETQLERAKMDLSRVFGTAESPVELGTSNLKSARNIGGALKSVNLRGVKWNEETDFRSVFMDGTVERSLAFEARMGFPCQWLDQPLSQEEFFSVWNWWVKKIPDPLVSAHAPHELKNIPPPSPERLEKLGLTDCEPGQPFGPMPAEE